MHAKERGALGAWVTGLLLALAVGPLAAGCEGGSEAPDAGDGENGGDAADGTDEILRSICPPCTPDCAGKPCGPDSCGGACGDCVALQLGNACVEHQCVWADQGDCTGKFCGPDGMGGSCGECPTGWVCAMDGTCTSRNGDCTGVPDTGLCLSGRAVTCEKGELTYESCRFGACVVDPLSRRASCEEPACLPRCFGRTCGEDGCGGSCGACAAGEECRADLGVCLPTSGCGEVDESGACQGQVLLTCEGGALLAEACLPQGKVCRPALGRGTRADCCMPAADEPCGDLPAYGQCAGDYVITCDEGELSFFNCAWAWSKTCIRTDTDAHGCGL